MDTSSIGALTGFQLLELKLESPTGGSDGSAQTSVSYDNLRLVPEPSTAVLLALGLAALSRRRQLA